TNAVQAKTHEMMRGFAAEMGLAGARNRLYLAFCRAAAWAAQGGRSPCVLTVGLELLAVGESREKARWRAGPAAPEAHNVFRCRARREVHRSVSPSRSSNWACRFPAPSSRTGVTSRHARGRPGEARTGVRGQEAQHPKHPVHRKLPVARP